MSEARSASAGSLLTRIFTRSRDQPNNIQEGHGEEIRRITEQKKTAEVELREAGGAKEECTNDLRKLEDQLRKKDEECRKQEEELMRSRRDNQRLEAMLKDAQDSLVCMEMELQEQSKNHKKEITRVEGHNEEKAPSTEDHDDGVDVDYRRQSVELREAGVVEEEWRNDRRRLEEQIRMQEEELMESRRYNQCLEAMLKDARGLLVRSEMKLQEKSRSHKEEIRRVEGSLYLEKMAIEQKFEKLHSEYKKLEGKYIALNKENDKLCEEIHTNYHNPPVVPTVSPHEYTQGVGKTHECWRLCAITLLRQNDDLLQNMANNLLPSCITGSTADWIHLCKALKVYSDGLFHIDSKARLLIIIQQCEQQTDGLPMTVRFLYDTLKSIKAKRAAGLLREKARFVYDQRKRSASENQILELRRHHNLEKSSASFAYTHRQNALFLDSLSESESESEDLKIMNKSFRSLVTMSSIDSEFIEISEFADISLQKKVNNSTLAKLDLSESQSSLTEMIKIAQLFRDNTENQKLNICNDIGIKFYPEAEFIVDVILSVNSTLSELVVNGTNIRPRFSNYSKILASNTVMNFSLQYFYIADRFPLYLSLSDVFKDNFVTECSDKNKKIIVVEEECPFNHTAIFTHYVDCEGDVYYYKDHDFALFIPPGAILQNDYVEIKVSSSFYGQFYMPQSHNRISSYVWVGANYNFKVPVYLVINHFVDVKSVKDIKALTAFEACKFYSSRDNDERVMMHEILTNYFDTDLRYCVISTDHFCTYCLAEPSSLSSSQEYNNHRVFLANYYGYKEEEPNNSITYIAEICCLYFNNNCLKNVKSQFAGKRLLYSKDFVMQSGQHLTLEYDKVEPDSEWCVTLNQQKLSKRKVSRFTGFHSNVRKTFADLASSVLKVLRKAIAQKIHREIKTFAFHRKSMKTTKLFSCSTFFLSFMIKYNEFDFQQYSDHVNLLKQKEDLHIYPPRFKLWCFKTNTHSSTSFSRSLSLNLMVDANTMEEICSIPFTTGPGSIDQLANVSTERLLLCSSSGSETEIDVLSIKPEMWAIIKIVFPKIKAKWQYVAYFMKYTPLEVKAFKNDSNDLEGSCLNLFTDWLTTNHGITPKTWQILIDKIKIVDGLQNAAENIEEEVKTLNM